jgi:signal transduction histidine kinase
VALLVTVLVAVVLGWWVAGRALRPLHRITATARRLSSESLHERIALDGPADELKELADTFDDMLERLSLAFESQRRFVANASHELRTPLALQRATIQIRLGRAAPQDIPRIRDELLATNRRSERLIEGLLQLARSDRGLHDRERVDLAEVVREVAGQCQAALRAAGLTLRLDLSSVPVPGDRVLLGQLVSNLLHNAIRYNVPGGTVWAELGPGRPLTIANTGRPVPPEQVPRLFEPFHRLDRRSEPAAAAAELGFSAGLGLSIVRSIATAHAGTVRARSRPGGGLEVEVSLPVALKAQAGNPSAHSP